MRVALYARVSTTNGQSSEMQLAELEEYASRRDFRVVGRYVDAGVSGSKESRPELNRLMADAHRRKFDAVLCWKIDRFGRSLRHLVNALADLDAYQVAFISLKDNLDLSTPSGRLMFQIVGAMAEFERALIQERVRAGLKNARAQRAAVSIADLHRTTNQAACCVEAKRKMSAAIACDCFTLCQERTALSGNTSLLWSNACGISTLT